VRTLSYVMSEASPPNTSSHKGGYRGRFGVSGRSRAESQVGVRLMGVWRVSYSNIQEFFFLLHQGRETVRQAGGGRGVENMS
jgi:hypothetical protein